WEQAVMLTKKRALITLGHAAAILVMVLGLVLPARGTSIVIDVSGEKVIITADSPATHSTRVGGAFFHVGHCKDGVLGTNFLFAETGTEGYIPKGTGDPLREWHATREATAAYQKAGRYDVKEVADSWVSRIKKDYESFLLLNPARAWQLEPLTGIFAG